MPNVNLRKALVKHVERQDGEFVFEGGRNAITETCLAGGCTSCDSNAERPGSLLRLFCDFCLIEAVDDQAFGGLV